MKEDLSKLGFDGLKKFVKSRSGRIEELQIEVDKAKFLIKRKMESGDFGVVKARKKREGNITESEEKPEKTSFRSDKEIEI